MRHSQLSYYAGPMYHDLATYGEPRVQRGRVFLVAVRGEPTQTMGRGSFDRVHVMVVDPNQMADLSHPLSVLCALPDIKAGFAGGPGLRGLLAVKSRPVCGEILRNQEGQFYEKCGRQLVPLRNLVSGPQGEIIEFLPPETQSRWDEAEVGEYVEADDDSSDAAESENTFTAEPAAQRAARSDRNQGVRKLFADPGQLRLLSYGEFSHLLAGQLKHPERLQETHQLPCYLQVYEVRQPMPMSRLAARTDENPAHLQALNPWLAQKLGLGQLAPSLRQHPPGVRPGLLPGDLVCRLEIVRDPTADLEKQTAEQAQAPRARANPVIATASVQGRTTIPEVYLKPWEFKMSREEATYDMNRAHAPRGWWKRIAAIFRERVRRSDFHRWTALLNGKGPDEQLWGVRPPQYAIGKTQIRSWACNTLALAGYDAQSMLAEWEVYWRRKGVS